MKSDIYYGKRARQYEAKRSHTERWANEQAAVERYVSCGPVLDVPLGTGRYVSIYRAKGLDVVGFDLSADMIAEAHKRYPDLDARVGDALALPFANGAFGTAVSTRLLDWFLPEDMARAVAEMKRVASTLVVSIRHGQEGYIDKSGLTYTHDINAFYAAIDGLIIDSRTVLDQDYHGTDEMFYLRRPTWDDVLLQVSFFGDAETPEQHINRMAKQWVGQKIKSYPGFHLKADTTTVTMEYWTADKLSQMLWGMVALEPADMTAKDRFITNEKPFSTDFPATICRYQGHDILLDGRRRANLWSKTPGRYPVLVIHPCAAPSR